MTDAFLLARQIADGAVGEALPDGALEWLRVGLRRWLAGEVDSLEVGLRLTGANRVAARNRHLLQATELIDAGRGLGPWALAGELADALRRFESGPLVILRRGGRVDLSSVDAALLSAFQTGARPKRSRRRLYDEVLTNIS